MSRNPTSLVPFVLPALGALLCLCLCLAAPSAVLADHCDGDWDRPFVCDLELYGAPDGQRLERLRGGSIDLALSGTFEIEVDAFDQNGRRFPTERLALGADLGDRCRDLVEVDQTDTARFVIRAGRQSGGCTVWLWVPGNLNLEWGVEVRVLSRARSGYSRGEAELIAHRLYAGILGREPDPNGLSDTVAEIQRGRLGDRVRSMVRSAEFKGKGATLNASALLEQLYRGLLGREPDSSGIRTFLGRIERGSISEVVLDLVRSDEFEEQLLDAVE